MSDDRPTQEQPAAPGEAGFPQNPPPTYGPGRVQGPGHHAQVPAAGHGQAPPHGYGQAPPHGYPPAPPPPSRPTNGMAIGALVAGILALLVCLIPFVNVFSVLAGIAGIVLGVLGIRAAGTRRGAGKGMSIAGILTGLVAVVVAVVVLVATINTVRHAAQQLEDVQRLFGDLEGLEQGEGPFPGGLEDLLGGEGGLEDLFGGEGGLEDLFAGEGGLEGLVPDVERPDPSTAVGIGEPAVDGDLELTVTGVEPVGTTLEDGTTARPDGVFVLVHLSVHNTGDETVPFLGTFQVLVDDRGQEHLPHFTASLTDPRARALTSTIAPGATVEGALVFDLPDDVEPAQLVLSSSLLAGGALVDLS